MKLDGPPTGRELQILSYISHGFTSAQIATELSLSVDTVRTHTYRLLIRLGATARAHAVRIGFEDGLLKPAAQRRPRTPRGAKGGDS